MKKLYLLILLTAFMSSAMWGKPDFSKSEKFQIACILFTQGCIVEGSFANQPTPLYHYQQPSTDNAAYWVITEESDGLYSIRNAVTGRYITYDGVRMDINTDGELRRYINMTDLMDGNNSLWTINHEGNGIYSIRNAEHTDHLWDIRTDSYCVGTFSRTESPNDNQRLIFTGEDGQTVSEMEPEPIVADGYDVSTWLKGDATSLDHWNTEGSWKVNTGDGGSHYNWDEGAFLIAPFIESWHASSYGPLDNSTLSQTLTNIPAGKYNLEADMMAVRQAYDSGGWWGGTHHDDEPATGVQLFANNDAINVATGNDPPEHFTLPFTLDAKGEVTLGIRIRNTNANWVAIDNIVLRYDGTWEQLIEAEKEKVREELAKAYSDEEAEALIAACGDDFEALEQLRARVALLPDPDPLSKFVANLTIDGYSLSYTANPDYYLCSVPLEMFGGVHTGAIDFTPNEGCTLKIGTKTINPGDKYFFPNISAGRKYTFTASDANGNSVSKDVTFTSLPVVRIYGSFSNDYSEGLIIVNEVDENLPEMLNMKAKWRGGITNGSDKHKRNYHVKLKDDKGDKLEKKFFGLRNDNSWILESCQVDMSRIRNRVLTDLWNDFCTKPYYIDKEKKAMSGTRGHFVELILNDEYRGIYCMTENLDRKQMKLKKIDEETQTVHGQLWKAKDWSYAVFMGPNRGHYQPADYLSTPYQNSEMWDNYQVKYPDFEDYGYQTDWQTLYDAVDFVCHTDDNSFRQEIANYFDLPVVTDYYILMELALATDNHGKNQFFAVYDKQTDKKITFAVWDMDATLGQRWSDQYYHDYLMQPEQDYARYIYTNEHGENNLYKRLRDTDANDFNMQMRLRYRDLRQDHLATENILSRFRNYLNEFKTCGAAQREYDKWSGDSDVAGHTLDFDVEMDYLTDWITRRMDYLDNVRFMIDELPSAVTGINLADGMKPERIIYDLQGKKVGTMGDYDRLPSGIYIINGKKSVKK